MAKSGKSTNRKTVDEVIMQLPKTEQVIVMRLRALILECLPKATEKVSLEVPFYTRHRMICFIWPPCIFWGPGRTKETQQAKGVTLGFCQGNRMANEDGVLRAESRKQVYVMYFKTLEEIDNDQIRALLFEAGMVDEEFGEKRKAARISRKV